MSRPPPYPHPPLPVPSRVRSKPGRWDYVLGMMAGSGLTTLVLCLLGRA